MPLKLAAVLQRSKEHPDSINDDISDYWEDFTSGNKYVGLSLNVADPDGHPAEQRLIEYVLNMGFLEDAIILVDNEWDVEFRVVEPFNWGFPEPVQAPRPWDAPVAGVVVGNDAQAQAWADMGIQIRLA